MANPSQVETVTTGADKAKLAAAVLLLIGAVMTLFIDEKRGFLAAQEDDQAGHDRDPM